MKHKKKSKTLSEAFADLEKLEWQMMFDTLETVKKRKRTRVKKRKRTRVKKRKMGVW